MSRWLRPAAVLLLAMSLTACVGPARNSANYHGDASAAVGSGLSEALTAHLVIGQWLGQHATGEYADVVLTDNETAIGPIEDSFGSRQPDSADDDDLRDNVLKLLSDEEDALAHARIAVRRSDASGVRQADSDITDSIKALTKAQASLG
jgi:hypothetical protein